jgi:hypothetical protein
MHRITPAESAKQSVRYSTTGQDAHLVRRRAMSDIQKPEYYVNPDQIATIPLAILRTFEQTASENHWRALDEERARGKLIRRWPPFVFADGETYGAAFQRMFGPMTSFRNRGEVARRFSILTVLGAWRVTRSIYCFDAELSRALAETDPASEIPAETLVRLLDQTHAVWSRLPL